MLYTCFALVARDHGLTTLKHLVENESDYEITCIFTHKFNPLVYDPEKKVRSDFQDFKNFAKKYDIPFFTVDSRDEKYKVETFAQTINFDFLLSISWRYIIPSSVFSKAKIGSIPPLTPR